MQAYSSVVLNINVYHPFKLEKIIFNHRHPVTGLIIRVQVCSNFQLLVQFYKYVLKCDSGKKVTKYVFSFQVEYDPTSLDTSTLQYTRVRLTAFLNGQYQTYMSAHAYKLLDIRSSTTAWTMEYWAKAQ